ncbi:MAG: hypothetical protein SFT94_07765 [Pseudanabaenaceae cyanobacterium bins.68]|nr:hypothetical protein [Pseudanabaenaceae cyanobacterium bins.68]
MRILFVYPNCPDYLSDTVLHGLKSLAPEQVIDFPKAEILYQNFHQSQHIYGRGFTLYGLLPDVALDRTGIYEKVQQGKFELIIFGDIHRCFGTFVQFLPYLNFQNTIILDGSDSPALYPYSGHYWRRPYFWFLPQAHSQFLYFKREWTLDTIRYLYYRLLPSSLCQLISPPPNLRSVSFGIPAEKIITELPIKQKLFPQHIVDREVAAQIPGSQTTYAFADEQAYYNDLQISKFGITTKRSGWDCLRHYEIAANGAVPCFRDLELKPATCAPHGLNQTNSISYRNYGDLIEKITALSDRDYQQLQQGAWAWVQQHTTVVKVQAILQEFSDRTGVNIAIG